MCHLVARGWGYFLDSNLFVLAPPPAHRVSCVVYLVSYQYVREQRPDALVCVMALFPRADPNDKSSHYPWPGIDEASQVKSSQARPESRSRI